jgi:hypothetical protein
MKILSQDKDLIFNFNWLSKIYAEDKYNNGKYYGSNVYGKSLFKNHMLGTYDEGEAQQVVCEIYKLLKSKEQFYTMPDVALDLSELFEGLD